MNDASVTIVQNTEHSPTFRELSFTWDASLGRPRAGQFLELRLPGTTAPLLRRPFAFSAYDEENQTASFVYEVRGTTTQLLSTMEPGMPLQILGPLGNMFHAKTKGVIAVGGGIGLGPILYAAHQLSPHHDLTLVTGYRSQESIPYSLYTPSCPPSICTDDGSAGVKGNVVEYLESLPQERFRDTTILACGPHPMLAALASFSNAVGCTCLVSMEEMMACGIGACMGCVIDRTDGTKARVCKEGPIFNSGEVVWT
ncbi:dihydroorotate dehydrogenase [Chitinivibrio alkaliphilus]|uniref:Dihydroorotate dehydrogenase electron transfer subunit n=1 Tax=Chitinivibrio alkaliphilus ACht1 TaxID=1313304 RepID=U7D4N7_9BACT|nr:dihydroorotate dehydrogenase [Chitinivibrio alkaliphilus]ERP30898.1 dihydroorotate dehydrogenase electron transfer subunit [Chitinivibrio alkaliphilus ACht1]